VPAHQYDLEERTFAFAHRVRLFLKQLPRTSANSEDRQQLIRASGSVGANYLEANDALGKKDFLMRIRISRKEAKESCYWPRLLDLDVHAELEPERIALLDEARQLVRIFSSIARKVE
jgi:four helix bundle protein